MNDRQNTVVATTLASLVLVVVFLCPWRVAPDGEIRFSPIYQPPLVYERSYDPATGAEVRAQRGENDAQIAFGLLGLELLAVGAAGGLLYVVAGRAREDGDPPEVDLP